MDKHLAGDLSRDTRASEIGGYFGLDLPDYGDPFADDAKFQSGRAAFRAVLEACGAERVHMPAYICSSMIRAANDAGTEVEIYHVDESLYPIQFDCGWRRGEFFVYVNYFGLAENNVRRIINDFPPERVIVDNSQALFSNFEGALASVYSPRKFVGLPDGGLLRSRLAISLPEAEDCASAERMGHLLTRLAHSAREGYAEFIAARRSLADNAPLGMSRLTRRLARAIPWEDVRSRRRENYRQMHERLGGKNSFPLPASGSDAAPLCYPFWLRGRDLRAVKSQLASENIFVPTYWEDALPMIGQNSIETSLVYETLFLPIDQRMNSCQLDFVYERVSSLIKELF